MLLKFHFTLNPLLPSAAFMRRSAKFFNFNLRRDHQKNFLKDQAKLFIRDRFLTIQWQKRCSIHSILNILIHLELYKT